MTSSLQHTLTVLAHKNIFNAAKSIIMRNPQENKGIIAHMNCITAPHANDWKMVIPTSSALSLTTAQYRLAARLNLRLDPFPHLALPNACPLCRSDSNNYLAVDRYHFLSCDSLKPREITSRHNAIVKTLDRFFNYAGAITEQEPSNLTATSGIRPDLSIVLPGHHYLVDVRVTHPLCPTYLFAAASEPLAATIRAEKEKCQKYHQLSQNLGAHFIPFVVETLGGITEIGETLLTNVVVACSEHQSLWSPQELNKELYGSISIAIQRGNAMAMTAGQHWCASAIRNIQQPRPNIHPDRQANIIINAA